MIIDTDVLIWFFRGNEKAKAAVVDAMPFDISIVTYMELVQGMRNKRELEKMKKAFETMDVGLAMITEDISVRAADYVERYSLSNSMELADALIASTCVEMGDVLLTANDKHYKVVGELELRIFRP